MSKQHQTVNTSSSRRDAELNTSQTAAAVWATNCDTTDIDRACTLLHSAAYLVESHAAQALCVLPRLGTQNCEMALLSLSVPREK
eukprot:3057955-Rhodomonas_salina.3